MPPLPLAPYWRLARGLGGMTADGGSSPRSSSWRTRATGVGRVSPSTRSSARVAPAPSSSSSRSTRVPRSAVSSSWTCRSGIRLMRSVLPSSWRTNGIARPRAAIVAVRSAGCPMTLTHTLAWRRSRVVSTFVIVANPMRGSATSRVTIAPISCRSSSSTRSVRWLIASPPSRSPSGCQPAATRLMVCEVKHSMMSPSSRSWKLASPMPHS